MCIFCENVSMFYNISISYCRKYIEKFSLLRLIGHLEFTAPCWSATTNLLHILGDQCYILNQPCARLKKQQNCVNTNMIFFGNIFSHIDYAMFRY